MEYEKLSIRKIENLEKHWFDEVSHTQLHRHTDVISHQSSLLSDLLTLF